MKKIVKVINVFLIPTVLCASNFASELEILLIDKGIEQVDKSIASLQAHHHFMHLEQAISKAAKEFEDADPREEKTIEYQEKVIALCIAIGNYATLIPEKPEDVVEFTAKKALCKFTQAAAFLQRKITNQEQDFDPIITINMDAEHTDDFLDIAKNRFKKDYPYVLSHK